MSYGEGYAVALRKVFVLEQDSLQAQESLCLVKETWHPTRLP